jgi:hypothetical protein
MINSLPLFHRIAGQPVIVLGEGEAAIAKRRLVERAGGVVDGEDNAEARLAFVALDDPEQAVARLKARGVLVNVRIARIFATLRSLAFWTVLRFCWQLARAEHRPGWPKCCACDWNRCCRLRLEGWLRHWARRVT